MKIFRKIRQNLLSEGATIKYLKYAIGEIVLVVIGILIAFSINTWNEARKQDIAEQAFIDGIKTDLAQDRDYMQSVIRLAQQKDSLYTVLSKELFGLYNTNRPLLDSLLQNYFAPQRTFYPISGSFQSAISGNGLSKFKNKRFSVAVIRLYNSTYARLLDNSEAADDKWHFFTNKYGGIRRTGHVQDMNKPEMEKLLDDMYYHIFSLNYYRDNLNSAVAEIDALLVEY